MPLAERRARYREMIAQLRESNVSVWRDNFLRDLQATGEKPRTSRAKPARRAVAA
jgi:trehalose 6-phosphate synthase